MTATIDDLDFDAVFDDIVERLHREKDGRIARPVVQLHDGYWNLRGQVAQEIAATFEETLNDTGSYSLDLPAHDYLAKWLIDVEARATTTVHVTCEKDGARLSGRMYSATVTKDDDGRVIVRALFRSDYEELKHILAWSNPFLPLFIQWPQLWLCYDRAISACKLTLLTNLLRLYSSAWMIPSNALSPAAINSIDMSDWWIVVAPNMAPDNSIPATVISRFKSVHEATKNIVADGQLTWRLRRWLTGDPPPWPGAQVRHGALVVDLVDRSGFTEETAFKGNIFSGLIREFLSIGADGVTENVQQVPDPNMPDVAFEPGFKGTVPSVPACIYFEGEHTGVQSSEFEHRPATASMFIGGGHSMPGVNELISAGVQAVGDLTGMIPGVPPLGGALDAVLKPIYTDALLAFAGIGSSSRASRLGPSRYHEQWVKGADRAYTISFLAAVRASMWETRERNRVSLKVADGAPWRIGQYGHGHFFLGDRVGFTVRGGVPGRIYVDQVSSLKLQWSREDTPSWQIQIGGREPEDPVMKGIEMLEEYANAMQQLGVL